MQYLEEETIYDFPDAEAADENGLLAIGGNLSFGTLINAYKKGIFPWYNPGEIIQWYSPDPRFVLFPDKLKISQVKVLQKAGIELIDCQVYTEHLESLGAEFIPRQQFIQLLNELI